MLTIRAAAHLLAAADSFGALRPIATLIGFPADPLPLSAHDRRTLGLADLITRGAVAEGHGAMRLLLAELAPPADLSADAREQTRAVAMAMHRAAPDRAWSVLTLAHDTRTLCLATVMPTGNTPRLAALRVQRERVLDSDADTLRALAALTEADDLLRHARFGDILGREALSHRFFRALERAVDTLATSLTVPAPLRRSGAAASAARRGITVPTPAERRELALLCASRCLFLAFLEAKGWLDDRRDFLLHHVLQSLETDRPLHDGLLRPLFFGTLNTPLAQRATSARAFGRVPFLNGGLFSPAPIEKRFRPWSFSNEAIAQLVTSVLDRHRFTAREDSSAWSEAAVDPEMLGRAFEGLMAADERRASGSFYTPPHLVEHTVHEALACALPELAPWLSASPPEALTPATATALRARVSALRILDPACGSGAFLVHTLERLDIALASLHDPRSAHTRRRDLLARSIFGVDRQPMAVWLCELRLWLAVVIECHETDVTRIPPLPNLDHHIRVGDSLAGGTFTFAPPSARTLTRLRERYVHASGARKQRAALALDLEERRRATAELTRQIDAVRRDRRQLLTALRTRDLFGQRRTPARADRLRLQALRTQTLELTTRRNRLAAGGALPFRFGTMFADVAATGGFDLVVGNPPWVRPHAMPAAERLRVRQEFRSMRHAAWRTGAARAGAGAGFAAQADLAVAFVERSVDLLADRGTLALLVPAKLWRTLSGGGIRALLHEQTSIRVLHDWSDAPAQFDAATYPSLIVATRTSTPDFTSPLRIGVTRARTHHFSTPPTMLALEQEPGAPWLLMPPDALQAFERIRLAGPPFAQSSLGRPTLGVKCGCNAAFLVHAVEHTDDTATVTSLGSTPRQAVVERHLLRPALRGEAVGQPSTRRRTDPAVRRRHRTGDSAQGAYSSTAVPPHELRILWTHAPDGRPLRTLPPATTRWLAQWRTRLDHRRDAKRSHPWWGLFRTDAARFDTPRVVWADIGRRLRSAVLSEGDPTVPLNSCYVIRCHHLDDAYALHALLSSTIANAWLDPLAEPARGGFRRFMGWTVSALPIPADWLRARACLAPLGAALARGDAVECDALDGAVLDAYALSADAVAPLLHWYRQQQPPVPDPSHTALPTRSTIPTP